MFVQPSVVLLSSSLLTDRMLRYSDWEHALAEQAQMEIWATSYAPGSGQSPTGSEIPLRCFPPVGPFREFPHNVLRRVNEFAWDYHLEAPSRISMIRNVRDKNSTLLLTTLRLAGGILEKASCHQSLEEYLNRSLLRYSRSSEARMRLQKLRPSLVVSTGPHRFEEPAVIGEAINLGIPVMAMITSWDNLTTKGRMLFNYDAYLVWSEQMKRELFRFYPHARTVPVYVVGAPQFDVFFQDCFHQSREEFCSGKGLDPARPYVVYALGSPNFLKEHHGAVEFARRASRGELGDVQVIIRPHPLFDNGKESAMLSGIAPNIIVQRTGAPGKPLKARTQDETQITEWVNTLRHAAVVVNLSSTIGIDAAILDKPVVNLDFDPEPGQPNQRLVKEVNHVWDHFKPVAESGGMWLANDMDEVAHATREYLKDPSLHREKRRWMAEYVCGFIDGKCGERAANATLDFLERKAPVKQATHARMALS